MLSARIFVSLSIMSVAGILFSLSASAQTSDLSVGGIRTYVDGNMHIFFDKPITSTCGSIARVPQGPGQENVRALAIPALLAERKVTAETETARSGRFCNLIYLRL